MRRGDREVADIDGLEAILKQCDVCRLALHAEPFPYLVPVNFGYARHGDRFALYFHGAAEGTKLDLLRRNPRAAFEVDCGYRVHDGGDNACAYSMEFESVVGQGVLSEVSGEEKRTGLLAVMRQYAPEKAFEINDAALESVAVLRLDVENMTGKRLRK